MSGFLSPLLACRSWGAQEVLKSLSHSILIYLLIFLSETEQTLDLFVSSQF